MFLLGYACSESYVHTCYWQTYKGGEGGEKELSHVGDKIILRNIPIINADILLICLFTFSNCLFTFTQHLFTSSLLFIYLRFSFIYLHSASPVYIFVPACLHFPLTLFIFSAYAQNIERKNNPLVHTVVCTKNYKAFWDNELNAGQTSRPASR